MKKIKKWRYYCDHCGKSGGSGGHMKTHEESCTKNKDRKCGLCRMAELQQKSSDELIKFMHEEIIQPKVWMGGVDGLDENVFYDLKDFDYDNWDETDRQKIEERLLEKLREFANGCPACMLTAMRLTQSTGCFGEFKWKDERDSFYSENVSQYGQDY